MNRKHKTLKWGIALVSSMLTLNLSAQSSLIDYQSDKVDLGMGVEQSQMLTTLPWRWLVAMSCKKRPLFL